MSRSGFGASGRSGTRLCWLASLGIVPPWPVPQVQKRGDLPCVQCLYVSLEFGVRLCLRRRKGVQAEPTWPRECGQEGHCWLVSQP
jgi:hypothetical protein